LEGINLMDEIKEYLRENKNLLAALLLMSMMLGVIIYAGMWMLSKDGIEDRRKLEEKNKLGMVLIDNIDRDDSRVQWLYKG
jgi:hypothetical protein